MRMSDWCSDVCASDLAAHRDQAVAGLQQAGHQLHQGRLAAAGRADHGDELAFLDIEGKVLDREGFLFGLAIDQIDAVDLDESRALHQAAPRRSEEHTSELKSLMRHSDAVFCLKKKNTANRTDSMPQ